MNHVEAITILTLAAAGILEDGRAPAMLRRILVGGRAAADPFFAFPYYALRLASRPKAAVEKIKG